MRRYAVCKIIGLDCTCEVDRDIYRLQCHLANWVHFGEAGCSDTRIPDVRQGQERGQGRCRGTGTGDGQEATDCATGAGPDRRRQRRGESVRAERRSASATRPRRARSIALVAAISAARPASRASALVASPVCLWGLFGPLRSRHPRALACAIQPCTSLCGGRGAREGARAQLAQAASEWRLRGVGGGGVGVCGARRREGGIGQGAAA